MWTIHIIWIKSKLYLGQHLFGYVLAPDIQHDVILNLQQKVSTQYPFK